MATRKARTSEEKKRDQDKRIQSKFGITLADRDERIRQQDNKCKICGGPLDAYGPPCLDHFHFKVKAFRHTANGMHAIGLKWYAQSYDECGQVVFVKCARTKTAAIAEVKKDTMPWSIRSLLCFKCNYGLGGVERFFDAARHPENLLPVIAYFHARLEKPLDTPPKVA